MALVTCSRSGVRTVNIENGKFAAFNKAFRPHAGAVHDVAWINGI